MNIGLYLVYRDELEYIFLFAFIAQWIPEFYAVLLM
jgi:hypothetical protein